MYSLHLTGNPWFLLLLAPGLWILWRQYRGGSAGGFPRAGWLLFGLQAAAMLLLTVSLAGPELRRHQEEFHNPAVLILRDQSGSFRGGAYLGLGGRYAGFQRALEARCAARRIDVKVADFAESAWPVSGFPRNAKATPSGEGEPLTSLAAAADFADSAAIPNLQAIFLFSDGRGDLDSGRAARSWRTPVYPVVFPPDSIAEVQPVRVEWLPGAAGKGGELEAAWRPVGKSGAAPSLRILLGGRTLLTRALDAGGSAPSPEGELRTTRFPWRPEGADAQSEGWAVIQPAEAGTDFDPWNDTLPVVQGAGRAQRSIHVLRPVRSLDEKGMFDILLAWEGTQVSFFPPEEADKLALTARDQVWVEAGAMTARLAAWLRSVPAKAVVYARPGAGRNLRVTGLDVPWRPFSPFAEVKPGKAAADPFPDEVVRLKGLTDQPLDLPEAAGMVEAREGGRRGLLMGRIPLGPEKRAFFFCLPAVWEELFDPQSDFATRENIAGYIKAAALLADAEDGGVRVSRPQRAYHMTPFDMEAHVPAASKSGARPELVVEGDGFSRSWPAGAAEAGETETEIDAKALALPRGDYRILVRAGAEILWRDSLRVAPKAALELARIGFDMGALGGAAERSGGKLIAPGPGSDVTSMLPEIPAAQIRLDKTRAFRLYNTLSQCLLVVALLSLSWVLRKKWDLD